MLNEYINVLLGPAVTSLPRPGHSHLQVEATVFDASQESPTRAK